MNKKVFYVIILLVLLLVPHLAILHVSMQKETNRAYKIITILTVYLAYFAFLPTVAYLSKSKYKTSTLFLIAPLVVIFLTFFIYSLVLLKKKKKSNDVKEYRLFVTNVVFTIVAYMLLFGYTIFGKRLNLVPIESTQNLPPDLFSVRHLNNIIPENKDKSETPSAIKEHMKQLIEVFKNRVYDPTITKEMLEKDFNFLNTNLLYREGIDQEVLRENLLSLTAISEIHKSLKDICGNNNNNLDSNWCENRLKYFEELKNLFNESFT